MQTSNGYEADKLKGVISQIQTLEARKLSIKMTAARECQTVAKDIDAVIKAAKAELGVPPKVLKAKVKELQLLAKAEALRDEMDEDDQDEFDLVSDALGDFAWTPLGAAALQAVQNVEVKMRAAADGVESALGKDKPKRKRTTAEERAAKRAAAASRGKQADIEDATKAAQKDEAEASGEVVDFVAKTHAERAAANGKV